MTGFSPKDHGRVIVKIGSSLLIQQDGKVRTAWLKTLIHDIARRRAGGQEIIVVCSGAIALGARKLNLERGGRASLADAQAAASVGQIILSGLWTEMFAEHEVVAAQMLVTLDDLEDRRRYLNATATLGRLLLHKAIPIINENDSVATTEIRFGDNDRLAARVAQAATADGVILLSDVDGLYDSNPSNNPNARLIPYVEKIDDELIGMADGKSASGMGTGGMASKLEAAGIANLAGIPLAIISGLKDNPLQQFIDTETGTIFKADRQANARLSWLGGRLTASGTITIDEGAARAIAAGKSLLAAGALSCTNGFERGDVINILDIKGEVIARGLSEYDANECNLIMGKQSHELAALLGHEPRSALVHANQLIML